MLRGLTWPQLQEWMDYDALEPFGERRADWQAASIIAGIGNILMRLFRRNPKWLEPSDFLLKFTSAKEAKEAKEAKVENKDDWKRLKFIAQMWAAVFNADEEKKDKRG